MRPGRLFRDPSHSRALSVAYPPGFAALWPGGFAGFSPGLVSGGFDNPGGGVCVSGRSQPQLPAPAILNPPARSTSRRRNVRRSDGVLGDIAFLPSGDRRHSAQQVVIGAFANGITKKLDAAVGEKEVRPAGVE